MAYSSSKSEIPVFDDCLAILTFSCLFAIFFSVKYGMKRKYILLELKVPCPMSVIPETYNGAHNDRQLGDILPNVSFTRSETGRDHC